MTLKNLFSGEKGKKILIIGGAAALLLLLLSTIPFGEKKTPSAAVELTEDAGEIERSLEKRLEELIGKIDGAGTVSVMVTLDRTSQTLYEKNEKTETNAKTDENGGTENTVKETETVLGGTAKEPLQTGVVQPRVRGAAVVCSGASDPIIREKVTYTVAKALNIGVSRVYVTD